MAPFIYMINPSFAFLKGAFLFLEYRNIYYRILNFGIVTDMSGQLKKRLSLTNSLAFFSILLSSLFMAITIETQDRISSIFVLAVILVMSLVLFFNFSGRPYLARHMAISGIAILGGIQHFVLGPETATNDGYFTWFLFPFLLFELKDKWHIISCSVIIVILFYCTEFLSIPYLSRFVLPSDKALIIKFCMTFTFFFIAAVMAHLVMKVNNQAELKLQKEMEVIQGLNKQLLDHQEALIKSSRLAVLGDMAGAMSHEINNPLAIIQISGNHLERLQEKDQLSGEAMKKTMKRMEEAVGRISKIMVGLRRFSGIEPSSDSYDSSGAELSVALDTTISLYEERLKNCGVILNADKVDFTVVSMNSVDIQLVIYNLLANALEHVKDLDVVEKWINIKFLKENSTRELIIENGGEPIPDELSDRIFEPFFTSKGICENSGLGLSVARGTMLAHGGSLLLDNSVGHTRFVLKFPMAGI